MPDAPDHRPILALDGVSPVASAAVALRGELLAVASRHEERSSTILLALVDEALREGGVAASDLGGIAATAGPGSFTGTRVTLATALGLRLGSGAPAAAVSTLEALALSAGPAGPAARDTGPDAGILLAAVDALRGDLFVQRFEGATVDAIEPPRRWLAIDPPELRVARLVGFGLEAIAEARVPGALRIAPAELASALALAASRGRFAWSADGLLRPVYLAAPNVRRANS